MSFDSGRSAAQLLCLKKIFRFASMLAARFAGKDEEGV